MEMGLSNCSCCGKEEDFVTTMYNDNKGGHICDMCLMKGSVVEML